MTEIDKCLTSTKVEPIRVIVRCRPMSFNEQHSGYSKIVNALPLTRTVQIFESPEDKAGRWFTFDAVYDTGSSQEDIYSESVLNIIDSVMKGYNATIFAYGQTGSGKTFTMEGNRDSSKMKGIIPRSFEQIFSHIRITTDCDYSVMASYVEIYNEEVRDLLESSAEKQYCKLREDTSAGVFVTNITAPVCRSVRDLEKVMRIGNQNRHTGTTRMNEHSSRSHAIFTITIEVRSFNKKQMRIGKLNLVDLAGSERQSKTKSTDEQLKEASKINLSLSALGNVILALGKKQNHIPYRDSKLTRLLQDSLGGNAKTLMIANIGPACYNYEETLMTLRYATRARRITNRPTINESSKDSMIRLFQEEIRRLKHLVAEKKKKAKEDQLKARKKLKSGSKKNIQVNTEGINNISLPVRKCASLDELLEHFTSNAKYPNSSLENEIENKLNRTYTVNDSGKSFTSLVQNTDDDSHTLHTIYSEKNKSILREVINMMSKTCEEGNLDLSINEEELLNHIDYLNQISDLNRNEIEKAAEQELELRQEISEQERKTERLATMKSELQHRVEVNRYLISEYNQKLRSTKARTQEIMNEFNVDRRDLNIIREELLKTSRLNRVIIENFIPPEKKKQFSFKSGDGDWEDGMEIRSGRNIIESLEPLNPRNSIRDWYSENEVLYLEPLQYGRKLGKNKQTNASRPLLRKIICTLEDQVNNSHLEINERDVVFDQPITTSQITNMENATVYPKPRGLVPR